MPAHAAHCQRAVCMSVRMASSLAALTEGVIVNRKHRFALSVLVDGVAYDCHCPSTGNIGGLVLDGLPCLLSASQDVNRKTPYTVEAISLDGAGRRSKAWIGINQNAANRYVEGCLKTGQFEDMVGCPAIVKREQFVGESKLDFIADDFYIEVKTPLNTLNLDIPRSAVQKRKAGAQSADRFIRHIQELAGCLDGKGKRAILLVCCIYDNERFTPPGDGARSPEIRRVVSSCVDRGVQIWQVNFKLTRTGVTLSKYFDITADFI